MNPNNLPGFKSRMEDELRSLLKQALQKSKDLPEIMHGTMVMAAAGDFCENVKNDYSRIKQEYLNLNISFTLTESEYQKIVDDVTTKVLGEFVDFS
tara:strand:+ start:1000 stop:1287 length:288 start_codon:yes stop_codon:yes gene_type:complete